MFTNDSFSRPETSSTTSLGVSFYGAGYGTAYHCHSGYDEEGLEKLKRTLKCYDVHRHTLATQGGNEELVRMVAQILNEKVSVAGSSGRQMVSLNRPDELRKSLAMVGQSSIRLNIRRLDYGLPAYYLARIHNDWWNMYSLVVEDIYLSPAYPLLEPRFVRITNQGRECYYLRLSLFREKVMEMLRTRNEDSREKADKLLYDLGRCIFQGAWHVDQRFAFAFAESFGLSELRNAIELIYLSLSCDLSAVRRFLTPTMHAFFTQCHANPGIAELLRRLDSMSGDEMSAVKQRGLVAYQRLADAMNETFSATVTWTPSWKGPMPLWKIFVANVNRLEVIVKQMKNDKQLEERLLSLNETASACIKELVQL
jgi:hypothetical protein